MSLSPSKLLIIFLALLQLITPFVHAHTGNEAVNQGIHLHELEHYSFPQQEIVVQALNHHGFTECSVISVGSGIQTKKNGEGCLDHLFLASGYSIFRTVVASSQLYYYFSYYPPPSTDILRIFSSRAPPHKLS